VTNSFEVVNENIFRSAFLSPATHLIGLMRLLNFFLVMLITVAISNAMCFFHEAGLCIQFGSILTL